VPGDCDLPRHENHVRLAELWCVRGPSPGSGSALTAFGVEHGTLLA
jgi:hypothetical protein